MYLFFKRISDIVASVVVLILLSPLFLLVSVWILLDSPGGLIYKQERVGKHGQNFQLLKFRSMRTGADEEGQITIGNDARVTRSGRFIRRFKIDEFPQLINVIKGEMSVVGPRPEVPKYVKMYSDQQRKVLDVQPGLTDLATIEFINEQEKLGESKDPESLYINHIMPAKLALNIEYIQNRSFLNDLSIIFKTIFSIFN